MEKLVPVKTFILYDCDADGKKEYVESTVGDSAEVILQSKFYTDIEEGNKGVYKRDENGNKERWVWAREKTGINQYEN